MIYSLRLLFHSGSLFSRKVINKKPKLRPRETSEIDSGVFATHWSSTITKVVNQTFLFSFMHFIWFFFKTLFIWYKLENWDTFRFPLCWCLWTVTERSFLIFSLPTYLHTQYPPTFSALRVYYSGSNIFKPEDKCQKKFILTYISKEN